MGSSAFGFTLPIKKGATTKILVNADFMERDNEKDISILRSNVQVIMADNYISCNEAIVLWSKNEIIAVGDVLLRTPGANIEADKVIYNFNDGLGKIYNGIIISGQMLIQSDFIDKTGENTYDAKDAYFTSCTTCPASWSFTADQVEATLDQYAYLTNPWLHFVEFPALYMPYLVIPLKNKRQTGLLPPTLQVDNQRGVAFELPFFWAINRSQDLTISPRYYTKSGLQLRTNYRYVLSEKSNGELDYAILRDAHRQGGFEHLENKKRWHLSYGHYLELPNDYVQRTEINLTSDIAYPIHFQQQFNFIGEPALDNRMSLTKHIEGYHLSLDASYYMSLLEQIDAGKRSSVHRVPEINFSITDKKILDAFPLYMRLDAQYVNYVRQGVAFDSLNNGKYSPSSPSGVFDPSKDQLRAGQRFDIEPYFYSPMRFLGNRIDITPFFSYRHSHYILGALNETQNFDHAPHRNYIKYGAMASTELSRISKNKKYRHSIIPKISFQTIPYLHQESNPFFGPTKHLPYFFESQPLQDQDIDTMDGRGLQFDYRDSPIIGRRVAQFSISNKVIEKSESPLGNSYNQIFYFRLSQGYDFIEANDEEGHPWQDLRGLMNIKLGSLDAFFESATFPYHKVTNVNARLRSSLWSNSYAELIYSNYLNIPRLPEDLDRSTRRESLWVSGGFAVGFVNVYGNMEFDLKNNDFIRYGVNTEIVPPGECWTIKMEAWKTLAQNKFNWSANVKFRFGN